MRFLQPFPILTALLLLFALPSFDACGADESADKRAKASELAKPDQEFVEQAAQGGMMKARLGEIGAEKATARTIKEFAAKLVKEHGKANQELQALAAKRGVVLEKELTARHAETVDRVAKLGGEEFDKVFVSEMIKSHKKGVATFEKAEKSVKDADLKAFVTKTMPVLKTHLQQLETMEKGASR